MDWGGLHEGGVADEMWAKRGRRRKPSADSHVPHGFQCWRIAGGVGARHAAYSAAEQARGEIDTVDERADVFGLGFDPLRNLEWATRLCGRNGTRCTHGTGRRSKGVRLRRTRSSFCLRNRVSKRHRKTATRRWCRPGRSRTPTSPARSGDDLAKPGLRKPGPRRSRPKSGSGLALAASVLVTGLDEGRHSFREAIRIDALCGPAYVGLGRALLAQGEFRETGGHRAGRYSACSRPIGRIHQPAHGARPNGRSLWDIWPPPFCGGEGGHRRPEGTPIRSTLLFQEALCGFGPAVPVGGFQLHQPPLADEHGSENYYQAVRCGNGQLRNGRDVHEAHGARNRWSTQSLAGREELAAAANLLETGTIRERSELPKRLGRWEVYLACQHFEANPHRWPSRTRAAIPSRVLVQTGIANAEGENDGHGGRSVTNLLNALQLTQRATQLPEGTGRLRARGRCIATLNRYRDFRDLTQQSDAMTRSSLCAVPGRGSAGIVDPRAAGPPQLLDDLHAPQRTPARCESTGRPPAGSARSSGK